MVCLGNICRSPLAEGILQYKIEKHKLDWQVDSAGTASWHNGERPDSRSQRVAKKHGIDISGQRSRQFQAYDYENFDLIFAMDLQNLRDIKALALNDDESKKAKLFLQELFPEHKMEVPDPYYGDDGFESVYRLLDRACDAFIKNQLATQK